MNQIAQTVDVFVVGNLTFASRAEADRAAKTHVELTGTAIDIKAGSVAADDLRLVKTVGPAKAAQSPDAKPAASRVAAELFLVDDHHCGSIEEARGYAGFRADARGRAVEIRRALVSVTMTKFEPFAVVQPDATTRKNPHDAR